MNITNSEFINCIEQAKAKLKAIELKHHPETIITAEDVMARLCLAIYDNVRSCVAKKIFQNSFGEQK